MEKDFADATELRILRWIPIIPRESQSSYRGKQECQSQGRRCDDRTEVRGTQSCAKKCRQSLEAREGKDKYSPPKPASRGTALPTHFGLLTCKNMFYIKSPCL
jgi:hypothetical protein